MAVATAIAMVVALFGAVAPAAAQVSYPGAASPGISIQQVAPAGPTNGGTLTVGAFISLANFSQIIGVEEVRPAEFRVSYADGDAFLAQCGDPNGPVNVSMATGSGVPIGESFLVNSTSWPDPGTPSRWADHARTAIADHEPALSLGDTVVVSMGTGCNTYTIPILTPPDANVDIEINAQFAVSMGNGEEFGCGFDSDPLFPEGQYIGTYGLRAFDEEGNQIGNPYNIDGDYDVQPWFNQFQLDMAGHQPALGLGDGVYMVWTGECDFRPVSQTAYVGGLPLLVTSVNPVTSAATSQPAMVLAGLALATAAVVGVRRSRQTPDAS